MIQPEEAAVAEGWYQRTCRMCQRAWMVPAAIAEERPDMRSLTSQSIGQIGASFAQQVALREHYMQLGAAARCPQCGATSFTQERAADPPAVPDASVAPAATPGAQAAIFVLNQKLISLTGDAWIEDAQGNRAFAVDGQLLSLRGTHVLKDLNGQALYEISKPLAPHLHKTISITRGGQTVATVQQALFNLAGDKFRITGAAGQELVVRGDWTSREFKVTDPSGQVAMTASRLWFSMHDAYGIQVAPGFDVPFGLAIAIALERVEDADRGRESPIQDLLGGFGPF